MSNYEVIVGNIGSVFSGNSQVGARKMFGEYRELSLLCIGRAAGESVTLMRDGEIDLEHFPDDCSRMSSYGCSCCDTD